MKKSGNGKPIVSGQRRLEQLHLEPTSGLPLPDPYPDYLPCPYCGEPAIEVWCYQSRVQCHNCGGWVGYSPPSSCPGSLFCENH